MRGDYADSAFAREEKAGTEWAFDQKNRKWQEWGKSQEEKGKSTTTKRVLGF